MEILVGSLLQFLIFLGLNSVHSGPVSTTEFAIRKLQKYGYIQDPNSQAGKSHSSQDLTKSIRTFQIYAGLQATGKLDKLTLEQFSKLRCGMPDISHSDNVRRKRRYALQGTKWNKNHITFKIENFTPHLKKGVIRAIFTQALRKWQDATSLVIRETTSDDADIKIRFIRGDHGDGYAFDGEGGELAHAFYPHNNLGISGDAHFDLDETFSHGTSKGTNLLWVATHEFGHSLGLDHSSVKGAIMFPWYQGYKPDLDLQEDDLIAIRQLYGRPGEFPATISPPKTPRPTRDPSLPNPCTGTMDMAFHGGDGQTYIFRGKHYWTVDFRGVTFGPEPIRKTWSKLPSSIDAGYQRNDGKTVFFKKSYVWVYLHQRLIYGPVDIRKYGLTLDMSDLDAVVVWGGNGKTYFFKGDKYWRYNDEKNKIDPDYPKPIASTWHGLPNDLSAALQWKNGKTYFFKKNMYYAMDDFHIKVEPTYPKMTARYWMGCTDIESTKFEKQIWLDENENEDSLAEHSSSSATVFNLWTLMICLLISKIINLW